ncbi:hypothetical protein ACODH8_10050 [Vagococcus fluvialis]|uniref:hypothetical protein n=1 Tax=Vagococcus fluvialis TaxID=2738 RepID=UPI003B58C0B3
MSEIEKHQVLVKKLTVENDFLRKENEALQTVVKVYQSHLETVVDREAIRKYRSRTKK